MKKIIACLLASMMLLFTACAATATTTPGGWAVAETNEMNEENKALFEKALDGLVGVDYEPIAYLGSQVVAGMMHCYLCKATVVYPNAVPTLVLVYIYEDLAHNAAIENVVDLDIAALATAEVTGE